MADMTDSANVHGGPWCPAVPCRRCRATVAVESADAIPLDVFKTEQDRISTTLDAITSRLDGLATAYSKPACHDHPSRARRHCPCPRPRR